MLDWIDQAGCRWTPPPPLPIPQKGPPRVPARQRIGLPRTWPVRTPPGRAPLPPQARVLKALDTDARKPGDYGSASAKTARGFELTWTRAPPTTSYRIRPPATGRTRTERSAGGNAARCCGCPTASRSAQPSPSCPRRSPRCPHTSRGANNIDSSASPGPRNGTPTSGAWTTRPNATHRDADTRHQTRLLPAHSCRRAPTTAEESAPDTSESHTFLKGRRLPIRDNGSLPLITSRPWERSAASPGRRWHHHRPVAPAAALRAHPRRRGRHRDADADGPLRSYVRAVAGQARAGVGRGARPAPG